MQDSLGVARVHDSEEVTDQARAVAITRPRALGHRPEVTRRAARGVDAIAAIIHAAEQGVSHRGHLHDASHDDGGFLRAVVRRGRATRCASPRPWSTTRVDRAREHSPAVTTDTYLSRAHTAFAPRPLRRRGRRTRAAGTTHECQRMRAISARDPMAKRLPCASYFAYVRAHREKTKDNGRTAVSKVMARVVSRGVVGSLGRGGFFFPRFFKMVFTV